MTMVVLRLNVLKRSMHHLKLHCNFGLILLKNNIATQIQISFINSIPHQSLVWGEKDVQFLRERYKSLSNHHLFKDMQYSEDPKVISEWMPLAMS